MPPSTPTTKLVSCLRLLIPRLRLLQKKDTASSVVQRRELAQLLEEGRDASARIRVENVISTDTAIEVMEMVELYCELLLARANVLDQVAFGEKGARARSRAKEEKIRGEMEKKRQSGGGGGGAAAAGAAGKDTTAGDAGGGSRSLFGFQFGKAFGGGAQQSKTTPEAPTGTTKDQNQNQDTTDDEISYIDPALDEAATAIFYAWPRFPHDVRELSIVRTLLADRYGKDFMALAQENKVEYVNVSERLAKGLRVRPPTTELVDSYLREIAKAYKIPWGVEEQGQEDLGSAPPEFVDEDDQHPGDGDLASTPQKQQRRREEDTNPETETRRASESNDLRKATPPRGPLQPGKSPVSVAPPAPRTDNPNPRVKVPGTESDNTEAGAKSKGRSEGASGKKDGNNIPEVDELSRRFAALRR